MSFQLDIFETKINGGSLQRVVNVASVPKRSPFRYPGGKTWLIPVVRKWLSQSKTEKPKLLVEPFAGGGIVSLTAAFEDLAERVEMIEIDKEVAAVWETILSDKNDWLVDKIYHFDLTIENVNKELEKSGKELHEIAFSTILKNRIFHGGIITKGSGLIKNGENGKGIHSRWYAKTLKNRISAIKNFRQKINFIEGDAFQLIPKYLNDKEAYFFIDPPYTVAGKRLYTHFELNHERLFEIASQIKGKLLMTYDDTEEVRSLSEKYGLTYKVIPMKTTHHLQKNELLITDNLNW